MTKPYKLKNMKLSRLKEIIGNLLAIDLTDLTKEQFENYCFWMGLELVDIEDDE